MNYKYLEEKGWEEVTNHYAFPRRACVGEDKKFHYTASFSLWFQREIGKVLIMADTNGCFEEEQEVKQYLARFAFIIQQTRKAFVSEDIIYIQNYQDFDPTKFLNFIHTKSQEGQVATALKTLPFEKQRRIGPQDPCAEGFNKFKGLAFCKDIEEALVSLGIDQK